MILIDLANRHCLKLIKMSRNIFVGHMHEHMAHALINK